MTDTIDNDNELTIFDDVDPDGVHLVRSAANGFPILLAKAVQETAAQEVAKAGKRLSAESATAIANARDQLNDLLGDDDPANEEDGDEQTDDQGRTATFLTELGMKSADPELACHYLVKASQLRGARR